jgi:CRP/FNR family cyclic AMP-dependent transcriptional regulator
MSILNDLASIDLLADLSPASLKALAQAAHPRVCSDGEMIMLQGDMEAPIFFVLQGTVRVFRTNLDGREQILIHLEPGQGFNMPAAFSSTPAAPASAIAVGEVRMICISPQDLRRASQDPEFALALLRDFADKLVHLTELAYDLSLRSVRGRLAQFLLSEMQGGSAAAVRWTHQEIAARIGSVREVVSRTLRSFVREGLIQVERHRIIIVDHQALAREAES